jgi:hypothetical protein
MRLGPMRMCSTRRSSAAPGSAPASSPTPGKAGAGGACENLTLCPWLFTQTDPYPWPPALAQTLVVEGVAPSPSRPEMGLRVESSPSRHAMATGEAAGRRSEVRAGGRELPAGSLEVWMAVVAVSVLGAFGTTALVAFGTTATPDCACCPFTAIGPPWVEGVEPSPSRPAMGLRVEPSPSRPAMRLGAGSGRRSEAWPAALTRSSSAALGSRSTETGGRETGAALLDGCDANASEPRKSKGARERRRGEAGTACACCEFTAIGPPWSWPLRRCPDSHLLRIP